MTKHFALVVEELIRDLERMTPAELVELRAAVEAVAPEFVDQVDTAREEASQFACALAGDDAVMQRQFIEEVPDWFQLGLCTALVEWHNGMARTCMHAPNPERPQPVVAVAWRPGLVVCQECLHLLRVPIPEVASTCNACGHVCAGDEDRIGVTMLTYSSLTYLAAVCGGCDVEASEGEYTA